MTTSTPPSPSSQRPRRRSSQLSGRNVPTSPMHSRHTSMSHRRPGSRSSLTSNGIVENGILSPDHANGGFGSPLSGINGQDGGLGSLEDELAGAWEDGEEEEDIQEAETASLHSIDSPGKHHHAKNSLQLSSNIKTATTSSPILTTPNGTASSPRQSKRRRHTRTESRYDGSDYDDPEDAMNTASDDLPPEIRMLIRDIDDLARQGSRMFLQPQAQQSITNGLTSASNGTSSRKGPPTPPLTTPPRPTPDATVCLLLARLRDLGQQANLETLTSRLITAHTSLTTHLAHQTRALQTAAFPLLTPHNIVAGAGPSPSDIDALLDLLSETTDLLPQPSFTSLNSLSHLSTTGKEAVTSLAGLSDSLHMSRQVETTAARRLKTARECVNELKREYELEEVGRRFIDGGNWDSRLKEREARKVCREVTGGFEEVCESWRRRLVEAAEVGA